MSYPSHPATHTFSFLQQQLTLLPERAIYWHDNRSLLLADVHLGKAGHFRKAGIPISGQVHWEDLSRLSLLIEAWNPKRIIILGDLFHSELNAEWTHFQQWLAGYPAMSFILVKGNHDILPPLAYELSNLLVKEETWEVGPFLLSHHPGVARNRLYTLAGHLHPSVSLQGKGRQRLSLPCFYFGQKEGILPAFGRFTGRSAIKPARTDYVFGITQDRIIPLPQT